MAPDFAPGEVRFAPDYGRFAPSSFPTRFTAALSAAVSAPRPEAEPQVHLPR